jgi:hypothetical protein
MTKNSNADNDYWEEYKRHGKDFRGPPEDLEDVVVEADSVRLLRKKNKDPGGKFIDE